MPLFTVQNLRPSPLSVPAPVGRVLAQGEAVTLSCSMSEIERSQLVGMERLGWLRVVAADNPLVSDELESTPRSALNALAVGVSSWHEPIITPSHASSLPGTAPTLIAAGTAILLLEFSAADAAWRAFKLPHNFVGNAQFHLHWTKSSNAVELGKAVRWQVTYKLFRSLEGADEDVSVGSSTVEYEDTYKDGGTTTRIIHRTPDIPAQGLAAAQPGYYLGVQVHRAVAVGTPMASNPALFSLDLTFDIRPNEIED